MIERANPFHKVLLFGLIAERFALGLTAALRPSILLRDPDHRLESFGRLYTRGFGIRHLALGLGLFLVRKNMTHLAQFALLNAAVEATDGVLILRESKSSGPPKSLAIGSMIGAFGCLALAYLSTEMTKPSNVSS